MTSAIVGMIGHGRALQWPTRGEQRAEEFVYPPHPIERVPGVEPDCGLTRGSAGGSGYRFPIQLGIAPPQRIANPLCIGPTPGTPSVGGCSTPGVKLQCSGPFVGWNHVDPCKKRQESGLVTASNGSHACVQRKIRRFIATI